MHDIDWQTDSLQRQCTHSRACLEAYMLGRDKFALIHLLKSLQCMQSYRFGVSPFGVTSFSVFDQVK